MGEAIYRRLFRTPGIKEAIAIMRFANRDPRTRAMLEYREKLRREEEKMNSVEKPIESDDVEKSE